MSINHLGRSKAWRLITYQKKSLEIEKTWKLIKLVSLAKLRLGLVKGCLNEQGYTGLINRTKFSLKMMVPHYAYQMQE